METFVYIAGISSTMKKTSNASVKRCTKVWKEIQKERAQAYYAEIQEAIQRKYNWLRQMEIM